MTIILALSMCGGFASLITPNTTRIYARPLNCAALFFSCVRAYREPGLGGAAVILLRIGLWAVGALVIGCTLYLLGSTVTIATALLLQLY